MLPNPMVPAPVTRTSPTTVEVNLEIKDINAKLNDGTGITYWTFGGSVPGQFIRVREGDTVKLTITNAAGNSSPHNIDLHAVNGPGGGAALTDVAPGESKTFQFKAMNPGVYMYHCATPIIPIHIMQGMYGAILVEPAEGMAPVDKEFYIGQGDVYVQGTMKDKGMQTASLTDLLDEKPDYVVFNGAVGAVTGERAFQAEVGDKVRLYFVNGGPNLTSSFHVIGEIFDIVAPDGSLTTVTTQDVQTVPVPPGAATMVEFTVDVPGNYIIVDHALGRLLKGAAAIIHVTGPENPEVYSAVQ
jgi:nitrite reductase (NO-forming)